MSLDDRDQIQEKGTYAVVSGQPLPESLDVVIGSLDERLSGDVIDHILLRGVD
jgi:hypothetical protein